MTERYGRFWLHEKIGHGGMAEVFRATTGPDPQRYSHEFALKRLHRHLVNDERQREMFLAEGYLSKLMVHPNIVRAYESGEAEGLPYITFEHVWGLELSKLIEALSERDLYFPEAAAVCAAIQIFRALDYIHRAVSPAGKPMDIVHRDITPSNLFITPDGQVKIADFGVARVNLLERREDADLVKGKVAYLPPEVLMGGAITQSADVWSASVCFYEMLAGRRLYGDATAQQVVGRASSFVPPGASDFGRASPRPELVRMVGAMLSSRPEQRPPNAEAALTLLQTHAQNVGASTNTDVLAQFVSGIGNRVAHIRSALRSAERDQLTGLYNHQRTKELIQIELDRSRRHGRTCSLLFVDVDNFSRINERLGATVADDILSHLALVVFPERVGLRSSDVLGRWGGDKFVILLPETPEAGAVVTAERVRNAISGTDWTVFEQRLEAPVTVSIGAACYPSHGDTVEALIEAAEVACYQTKSFGKNDVMLAEDELSEIKRRIEAGEVDFGSGDVPLRPKRTHLEQRRFGRTEVAVEIQVDGTQVGGRLFTEDLSPGGLRVVYPHTVAPGEEVELTILLGGQPPATVRARVAWRRRDGMVGMEFIEVPPRVRESITAMLDNGQA